MESGVCFEVQANCPQQSPNLFKKIHSPSSSKDFFESGVKLIAAQDIESALMAKPM
jgi:hypothetical protein